MPLLCSSDVQHTHRFLERVTYSIISNKDIYIYFRMLCIPGYNLNSYKHNSFENIACPKKVVSWHNLG